MDIATIIGVMLGFICIIGAIAVGAGAKMFFNIPSLVLTIGGMICATLIHFSLPQFLGIFSVIKKTLFTKLPSKSNLIQQMINFAAVNRRDGALALEPEIRKLDDHFFAKGLQMVVDGQDEEYLRDHLSLEIENLQDRHSMGKKILEFMGASAPAFGMIGTLIGLIQMLSNLSDPSQLGAGMATALVTTFYGAFASNLFFIPLAGKLGIYSKEEAVLMEMTSVGLCAIAQGESPMIIREKMQAFLSHKNRKEVKATI